MSSLSLFFRFLFRENGEIACLSKNDLMNRLYSNTSSNIIFIEDLLSNTKKSVVAVKSLKKITDEKKT